MGKEVRTTLEVVTADLFLAFRKEEADHVLLGSNIGPSGQHRPPKPDGPVRQGCGRCPYPDEASAADPSRLQFERGLLRPSRLQPVRPLRGRRSQSIAPCRKGLLETS